MKAIKLLKDIPAEGLCEGDVLRVDVLSAANMIEAGDAEAYEPKKVESTDDLESVRYGGRDTKTIDDIHDPDAQRSRRVTHVTIVGQADPGPAARASQEARNEAADAPAKASKKQQRGTAARGASGAEPAGGDAGGGDAG